MELPTQPASGFFADAAAGVVFESVAEEKVWVFGADGSVRQRDWEKRRHVEELIDNSLGVIAIVELDILFAMSFGARP